MNCDDVVVLFSCIYHLSSWHKYQECLEFDVSMTLTTRAEQE
jgi:hypothetical protein